MSCWRSYPQWEPRPEMTNFTMASSQHLTGTEAHLIYHPTVLEGAKRTSIHGWLSTPHDTAHNWKRNYLGGSGEVTIWGYRVRALKIINKQQGSLESFELLALFPQINCHAKTSTRWSNSEHYVLNVSYKI